MIQYLLNRIALQYGRQYVELKTNEIVAYTARFDDPHLPGEMTMRVTIKAVSCGVDVHIAQSGIPEMIPAESCYLGWQKLLRHLAKFV